jgi:hypothetical protein
MKYIPAGILLLASAILLNPIYAPVYFWLAWFGFCFVLMITMMDDEERRDFFLIEKPRRNGTNR